MITETKDIIAVIILVILASVGIEHILRSIWEYNERHFVKFLRRLIFTVSQNLKQHSEMFGRLKTKLH